MKSTGIPQTVVEQAISFLLALPHKSHGVESEPDLPPSDQSTHLVATGRQPR